jgi:hypothetical protein
LEPKNRCLVPANSFAEYAPEPNPDTKKKDVVWFALNDDRPPFAFAGIWTEFKGDRGTKSKPIPGPHLVYGFLTTSPNAIVEPIHPMAMPVILTTDEERDVWMRAVGRSESAAAAVARRCIDDRGARCRQGRSGRSVKVNRGWKRPFDDPIVLPDGHGLVTLEDAGDYITRLPKADQQLNEWQTAIECMMLVVELGGPTMFARIGMMKALNRHVERPFNPDRKDMHWGRRKRMNNEVIPNGPSTKETAHILV